MRRSVLAAAVFSILALGGSAVSADASSQVFVNCQTFSSAAGFGYRESVRPSACVLQGLPGGGVNESNLSGLHWSGWGTVFAVGTGVSHARHGEEVEGRMIYPTMPTRIVLSRIRVGCGGRRFYTRMLFAGKYGEATYSLSAGCRNTTT